MSSCSGVENCWPISFLSGHDQGVTRGPASGVRTSRARSSPSRPTPVVPSRSSGAWEPGRGRGRSWRRTRRSCAGSSFRPACGSGRRTEPCRRCVGWLATWQDLETRNGRCRVRTPFTGRCLRGSPGVLVQSFACGRWTNGGTLPDSLKASSWNSARILKRVS